MRRLSCFRWTYFLGALCINDSTDYATVWDCQASSRQHAAHFAYPAAGCALGMGQPSRGREGRLTNAFCRLHSQSNAQHAAIKSERKVFWTIVMPNEKSKCPTIVPRHLATDAIEQKRNRVNERETLPGERMIERERESVGESQTGCALDDTVNFNVCRRLRPSPMHLIPTQNSGHIARSPRDFSAMLTVAVAVICSCSCSSYYCCCWAANSGTNLIKTFA